MLLLLLSSFPLLPSPLLFLFHSCPESAALTTDAGCHEGLGELNSSEYPFPCSRYAHCFACFSHLLSLLSLLSLLCLLSLPPTLPKPSCTSCFPVLLEGSFSSSPLFVLVSTPSPDTILSPSPPLKS